MYAASAIAANTVARSAAGASAPLFTNQMFAALGVGGGASLVGGVAALLAIVPFIFYKYGEGIRRRSKFAPTPSKDDEESSSSSPPGAGEADDSSHHERNEHAAEESDDSDSTVAEERGATKDAREKNNGMDIPQNAFGQPRTQNINFGKQDA
jgi:MFS transporter, DHA1 family, multidrug resistance protein